MGAAPRQSGCVVIKIGSAIVAPSGRLDPDTVARLAREITAVVRTGRAVVLVSSGAVACGLSALGLAAMPDRIVDRQAAAAAGQPRLVGAWMEALTANGVPGAQVLLTADDVEDRARFVNARATIERLVSARVVPVVNENDSVAFDELRLGDNDRLSALTAGLSGADRLVILSEAPGLCRGGPGGEVIPVVEDPEAARVHVGRSKSSTGVGGMMTKLEAAGMARSMGIETVIAPGAEPGSLVSAALGEAIGTRFPPASGAVSRGGARKHWIGHAARTLGELEIDAGAARALRERGASLLPKGVVAVRTVGGPFGIGSPVEIVCDGLSVGRGLVSYASGEVEKILGAASAEISARLGYTYCDEVVHRDNLILNGTVAETLPATGNGGSD